MNTLQKGSLLCQEEAHLRVEVENLLRNELRATDLIEIRGQISTNELLATLTVGTETRHQSSLPLGDHSRDGLSISVGTEITAFQEF